MIIYYKTNCISIYYVELKLKCFESYKLKIKI